jgi:hypothetical protein
MYKTPVAARISAKALAAYQAVSRAASDGAERAACGVTGGAPSACARNNPLGGAGVLLAMVDPVAGGSALTAVSTAVSAVDSTTGSAAPASPAAVVAVVAAGSVALFQDISHAPHRVDQLLLERVVHLRAQPANVHVDHVRLAVEVHVPDLFGDQRA